MKIKQSQLKEIIKQIVRESIKSREFNQILNESSPPGKKAEKMIQHVKKSLRKSHPDWDEEKITSVAIATGWKAHNKGTVEEAGLTSENQENQVDYDTFYNSLVEWEAKDLIEMIMELVSKASPDVYQDFISKYIHLSEATYKVVSPNSLDTAKEDKARKIQTEPKVSEGCKVQHRSAKTVKDLPNNPKNVEDPEVPMS